MNGNDNKQYCWHGNQTWRIEVEKIGVRLIEVRGIRVRGRKGQDGGVVGRHSKNIKKRVSKG